MRFFFEYFKYITIISDRHPPPIQTNIAQGLPPYKLEVSDPSITADALAQLGMTTWDGANRTNGIYGVNDSDGPHIAPEPLVTDSQSGIMDGTDVGGKGFQQQAINGQTKIITKLEYQPSSGVTLHANPQKTTTVLGSFTKDMKNIVNEMGNIKSTDFGVKMGGFNVLNVPDDMYIDADQFWHEVNKPWLDEAIRRGDDIILATKPTEDVL